MHIQWFSRKRSGNNSTSTMVAVVCDHAEMIAIVARRQGTSVELVETLRESIAVDGEWGQPCRQLAEQIKGLRLGRYELLIGIARSQVEMKTLELPPVGPGELPVLVRNEMFRQLGDLSNDSVIDYRTPFDTTGGTLRVEAAALRPESANWVSTLSDALEVSPTRIVIRSLAVASRFFRQAPQLPHQSVLLTMLDTSADLSVLKDRQIVFSRSIRMGADDFLGYPDAVPLADEIRRTLFTAPGSDDESDEEGEDEPPHVYLLADYGREHPFVAQLAYELQGTVSVLDPLTGVVLKDRQRPQNSHQLAALFGMVWDHVLNTVELDFAQPKQPPVPPRRGRKIAIYAAVATTLAVMVLGGLYRDLSQLRARVADVSRQLNMNKKRLENVVAQTQRVDTVARWETTQTNWLDELQRLSQQFPASDEAVIQRMTLASSAEGGVISMSVKVRDPAVLAALEDRLRDERHQVSSQRVTQADADSDSPYRCQFETSVVVVPGRAQP